MSRFFSTSYAEARAQFRHLASEAGAELTDLPIEAAAGTSKPLRGPNGETLTIDIAWMGEARPKSIFVHSSGIHGVEGFAGSAIQCEWLSGKRAAPKAGAAVALVHCVNPFGMAWLRRSNENNVDLNRNFCEFPTPAIDGSAYARLDSYLNPTREPSGDAGFYLTALALIARYGFATLKQAVAGGQRDVDEGLFFGGRSLESGPAMLRAFFLARLASADRLVGIDVHTGLGKYGIDTLLVDSPASLHAMRHWGARVELPDAKGIAYMVDGPLSSLFEWTAPGARRIFAFQEFGTYSSLRVLQALRVENYWRRQGVATSHRSKQRLLEVFCPPDRQWRDRIVGRGVAVIAHGLRLLESP